jgi:hypothetical protein
MDMGEIAVTEHKPGHKCLHEAQHHTRSAQEIIHELLDGPDEVDQTRLDEAAKALRIALRLIDPDMDVEKL